jgi:hypothetical protein
LTGLPVPLRLVRQVPPQRREVASEPVTGAWGRAGITVTVHLIDTAAASFCRESLRARHFFKDLAVAVLGRFRDVTDDTGLWTKTRRYNH